MCCRNYVVESSLSCDLTAYKREGLGADSNLDSEICLIWEKGNSYIVNTYQYPGLRQVGAPSVGGPFCLPGASHRERDIEEKKKWTTAGGIMGPIYATSSETGRGSRKEFLH